MHRVQGSHITHLTKPDCVVPQRMCGHTMCQKQGWTSSIRLGFDVLQFHSEMVKSDQLIGKMFDFI